MASAALFLFPLRFCYSPLVPFGNQMESKNKTNLSKKAVAVLASLVLVLPLFRTALPSANTLPPWITELAGSVLILGLIAAKWKNLSAFVNQELNRNRMVSVISVFFLSFIGWSFATLLWAGSIIAALHHSLLWVVYLSVFLITLQQIWTSKSLQLPISILTITTAIVFVALAVDTLSNTDSLASIGNLRIRYSKYGEMMVLAGPLLVSIGFVARAKRFKLLFFACAALGWLTAMLSLSKAVFISGLIAYVLTFAFALVFSNKRFRRSVIAVGIGFVFLTAVVQIGTQFAGKAPATVAYISGEAEKDRSTSQFRVFVWRVGLEMAKENPLLGVGADNFGFAFNKSRASFSRANPGSPLLGVAEDHLAERAHNEPLQVLAETGVPGLVILGLLFSIPAIFIVRHMFSEKGRINPVLLGALGGMAGFAVNSMVSSYSFRAAQNGYVFIVVFAVAIYLARRNNRTSGSSKSERAGFSFPLLAMSLGVLSAMVCFGIIGLSNRYSLEGQIEKKIEQQRLAFDRSLELVPGNGGAMFLYGVAEHFNGSEKKAASLFRDSIDNGLGATLPYYYLASSQELSGDIEGARKTLSEAAAIYPRSVYVNTHLAYFQKLAGDLEASERHYKIARDAAPDEAETWKMVFEGGLLAATDKSRNRKDLKRPDQLFPDNIIRAIYAEEQSGLRKYGTDSRKN